MKKLLLIAGLATTLFAGASALAIPFPLPQDCSDECYDEYVNCIQVGYPSQYCYNQYEVCLFCI